jgi:hypothetical protein
VPTTGNAWCTTAGADVVVVVVVGGAATVVGVSVEVVDDATTLAVGGTATAADDVADAATVAAWPQVTATFTSRGSNRWPAGATVKAATISGHRDTSQTACPGPQANWSGLSRRVERAEPSGR